MGIFQSNQSDEEWLAEIRPPYDAASAAMRELDRALDGDSLEDRYAAVQRVLEYLPLAENSVKQIRSPSSTEAQQAHKKFKSALKNYKAGAKQGALLFKDMAGGPGQRAANETGYARRAAVGRLAFNDSLLRSLARSGNEDLEVVSRFLAD